ncbi:hypothetical protein DEU56DRAFT_911261 [Suillus clintonianus]|uniref:uncharacterized protein n=1 Tax=Suillus clintonianus TaxID=1904413 RepID=UPI001B861C03|nr:uncharacterized protein DEU56DRAFT_911261 [Suillus clintonianus]KAG2141925.1 hypothetical protein DEU56DRAFT_911261 [Suillus clintonianus]
MSEMQAVDGSTANPGVSFSATSESDIIGALRNILARSQVIIPDLETPSSRKFSTINHSDIEIKDKSIGAIINERQQQLDITLDNISDLETIMDDIKSLHQQLIKTKDRITQSLNLHKRLVSAVWRLPTEVLAHIFGYCLPTHHQDVRSASNKAPMLLTRICRRWREVAVHMPSLRYRLRLNSGEVHNRRWKSIASAYDLWLKRSQGLPLSLEVLCHKDDSDIRLRKVLQPYINQISSLSIRGFTWAAAPQHMFKDLPALQELTVCEYEGPKSPWFAQIMSQLPFTVCSLKVARLEFILEDLPTVTPLLAHLTNIEFATYELRMVLNLLRLCPSLSSLTICTCITQRMQPEPITHTKLRSL